MPVSTYGASKLAGEALLCVVRGHVRHHRPGFRFGNVVGPRQTHGVGFDFVRRLLADPTRLRILGDGQQSKSYVHVEDVIAAVLLAGARRTTPFAVFNVATGDYVTVTEIAELAMEVLGLDRGLDDVRVHRRRPRLEGRCARRPARTPTDPRAGLEERAHRSRRRCATRWPRWPTTPGRVGSTT